MDHSGGGELPSALVGSMGREKKPFTYLPGGLDFSEIRSPRMAKRLARHQANIIRVSEIEFRILLCSFRRYVA